jgi:hypothetical protein
MPGAPRSDHSVSQDGIWAFRDAGTGPLVDSTIDIDSITFSGGVLGSHPFAADVSVLASLSNDDGSHPHL